MCGICGILSLKKRWPVEDEVLASMKTTLQHRSPDDAGSHVTLVVGLAMRRLTIIDLTTGGQPVSDENQSVWVVFNGEIYNFQTFSTCANN